MMLIKVLAVALAPGDCRVLSGKTREFQGPPSFPYTPGGDCCGIVIELPPVKGEKNKSNNEENKLPFQVGDRVAARFVGKPLGALAEYALVSTLVAEKVPSSTISSDGAAALASACPATMFAERIRPDDRRILVLGAGGGMGSHFCQLLRARHGYPTDDDQQLFLVGVSRSPQRLLEQPYNCDRAIDYTKDNPFQMPEFINDPFDVIVDFASGGWLQLREATAAESGGGSIVKPACRGGRFLTTAVDTPTFEIHSIWKMLKIFLLPPLWRAFITRTWFRNRLPKFTMAFCLPDDRSVMTKTMQYATAAAVDKNSHLVPVIHDNKPFPFTTQGVRDAFRTLESHHPHGKVVIHVADE
jgi:NADPH:quinone reductase-like Zn-dependent oxidoreductase